MQATIYLVLNSKDSIKVKQVDKDGAIGVANGLMFANGYRPTDTKLVFDCLLGGYILESISNRRDYCVIRNN